MRDVGSTDTNRGSASESRGLSSREPSGASAAASSVASAQLHRISVPIVGVGRDLNAAVALRRKRP